MICGISQEIGGHSAREKRRASSVALGEHDFVEQDDSGVLAFLFRTFAFIDELVESCMIIH